MSAPGTQGVVRGMAHYYPQESAGSLAGDPVVIWDAECAVVSESPRIGRTLVRIGPETATRWAWVNSERVLPPLVTL